LVLCAVASAIPVPWTECSQGPPHLVMSQTTADPWPPVLGANITFTLAGTLDETIMGATSTYAFEVDTQIFDPITGSGPLSDFNVTTVPAKTFNITRTRMIPQPPIPLSGPVHVHGEAHDGNGQWIICFNVDFTLATPAPRPARRSGKFVKESVPVAVAVAVDDETNEKYKQQYARDLAAMFMPF